jgi:hypothetical protein
MRKFQEVGIILGLFCFVCVLTTAGATAQTLYFNVHDRSARGRDS